MMRRATRTQAFWLIVAVQVGVLVGMVALQERTLARGTIVKLHAQPVDPTDLARGSYVDLNYDVENIATKGPKLREGADVVVGLRKRSDGTYAPTRAYRSPNDMPEGQLFVRGVVGNDEQVDLPEISAWYASTQDAQAAERKLSSAAGAIVAVSLDVDGSPTLCGLEGVSPGDTDSCGLEAG